MTDRTTADILGGTTTRTPFDTELAPVAEALAAAIPIWSADTLAPNR
jgi:hypothetical protein